MRKTTYFVDLTQTIGPITTNSVLYAASDKIDSAYLAEAIYEMQWR